MAKGRQSPFGATRASGPELGIDTLDAVEQRRLPKRFVGCTRDSGSQRSCSAKIKIVRKPLKVPASVDQ